MILCTDVIRIIVSYCDLKTRYRWSLTNSYWPILSKDWCRFARHYGVTSHAVKPLILRDYGGQWDITREPCHLWSRHLHEPLRMWSPWTLIRACKISYNCITLIFREFGFLEYIERLSYKFDLISNIQRGRKRHIKSLIFFKKRPRIHSKIMQNRKIYRKTSSAVEFMTRNKTNGFLRAFLEFHIHQNRLRLFVRRLQFERESDIVFS